MKTKFYQALTVCAGVSLLFISCLANSREDDTVYIPNPSTTVGIASIAQEYEIDARSYLDETDINSGDEQKSYIDYSAPWISGFKSYMSYNCITAVGSSQYKLQNNDTYTGDYGIRQVDGDELVKDINSGDEQKSYIDYSAPWTSGFKSYMSYNCITAVGSSQYKLQNNDAYTGEYGIRQVDGRYCVAIGSYFTSEIGTLFDLVLKNGTVIPCILADQKADKDTDAQNIITVHNGCMTEFIVDMNYLHPIARRMGDISYCNDNWNSPVDYVRVYIE